MNTFYKYCPNVFVAKCSEEHEKGEIITLSTKYGKEVECEVYNRVLTKKTDGFYYSIVRTDGYNVQERAKRKVERYANAVDNATRKANDFFNKSQKDAEFLSLGEPIKVGHHSEKRHRKMIDDAWCNTNKMVEQMNKAKEYTDKANYWHEKENTINLSMPESVEYYTERLEKAKEYHEGLKSGKYPREHAYSLTYAKKAVNELAKNLEIARKLWA